MAGALALVLLAAGAAAQPPERPNAMLLVAKPGMPDPRFRDAVVLVTQTSDSQTFGVILNRPTTLRVKDLLPDTPSDGYRGPVFFGGPVMPQAIAVLFKAEQPPAGDSFHVLPQVYLSLHPSVVEPLLAKGAPQLRVFAGFSGWAPGQLQAELEADTWYALPAREALVFRKDTSTLWRELLERARRKTAALYWPEWLAYARSP